MDNVKTYKVKYQILTPVHIGAGQDLSPFDYVIVNEMFHRIIVDELISSLNQEQLRKFYTFVEDGNITGLRNLIVENFNEEKFSKYKIKVFPNIADKYKRNLNNINNQLLISPFVRTTDDFKPYIPGSSIKGAIRTAIIDSIVQSKGYKPPKSPGNNSWELEAMGALSQRKGKDEPKPDISKDPFRTLKVSDVFISNDVMAIGEVFNARVDKRRDRITTVGIQMIKEVLLGQINTGKIVEFEGEIRIDEFLPSVRGVARELNKDFIIQCCNKFYNDEFKREQEFYELALDMHDIIDRMRSLFRVNQNENECVIRVGRFSGVYAVTINNFRNPHNRKWRNTRNLFEGKYPMGWVKVKFLE